MIERSITITFQKKSLMPDASTRSTNACPRGTGNAPHAAASGIAAPMPNADDTAFRYDINRLRFAPIDESATSEYAHRNPICAIINDVPAAIPFGSDGGMVSAYQTN